MLIFFQKIPEDIGHSRGRRERGWQDSCWLKWRVISFRDDRTRLKPRRNCCHCGQPSFVPFGPATALAPTSERGVPHILHASPLQRSRSQCICSATMHPFPRNEQASVPSLSPSPLKRPWPFGEDGDHRSSASTPQSSSQVSETSDSSAIDNICFGSVNPVISGRWFHN